MNIHKTHKHAYTVSLPLLRTYSTSPDTRILFQTGQYFNIYILSEVLHQCAIDCVSVDILIHLSIFFLFSSSFFFFHFTLKLKLEPLSFSAFSVDICCFALHVLINLLNLESSLYRKQ